MLAMLAMVAIVAMMAVVGGSWASVEAGPGGCERFVAAANLCFAAGTGRAFGSRSSRDQL
jgi:hypothetical protein